VQKLLYVFQIFPQSFSKKLPKVLDNYSRLCYILSMQKTYTRLKEFSIPWVLNTFGKPGGKILVGVSGENYSIKKGSHRYILFKEKGLTCVICGRIANKCFLELPLRETVPHFNFYVVENGLETLFTKDHIIPKSKGGKNCQENYQPMCQKCNNKKDSKYYEQPKTIPIPNRF